MENRTAHSMTQVLGLGLMSLAMVAVVGVSLVLFGMDDDLQMIMVITGLLVGATALAWRFDATWARVLGLLVSFAVASITFFLAFGVFQLFSPLEFVIGLAYSVGFVFAMVGGVRALMARDASGTADREARLRSRVLIGIAVLSAVSIVGVFVTRETVSDAEASGAVAMFMRDFEFDPRSVSVPKGGKLLLHNSDAFVHDFTSDALGIAVTIGPGSESLIDLSDVASGTYLFVCTLHTDPSTGSGMNGVLTISG